MCYRNSNHSNGNRRERGRKGGRNEGKKVKEKKRKKEKSSKLVETLVLEQKEETGEREAEMVEAEFGAEWRLGYYLLF